MDTEVSRFFQLLRTPVFLYKQFGLLHFQQVSSTIFCRVNSSFRSAAWATLFI
jgi:hypothetical protein